MDPDQQVQPRSMVRLLWQHARQSSARIPTKGWIAAATVLVVGLLLILHASISKDATLRFRLQHTFHTAQVSLWIDGDLTYSGKVMGAPRRRFGVIPDGSMVGTVSQVIPVSSGRHRIKVRVEPEDGNVQEAVIGGEFQSHAEENLTASAKDGGVSLSWAQERNAARESVAPAASSSDSSGFGHYVSWLLLTMAGSLISALTGYAVKEVPAILRNRQNPAAKSTAAGN
jgi:hypothetical protein